MKIDVDENQRVARACRVPGVPVAAIFRRGEVADALSGERVTAASLGELIDRNM